jgi:hypothetical protein
MEGESFNRTVEILFSCLYGQWLASSGLLSKLYASSDEVVKLVSVLVSVWTAFLPKPLLHMQMELEARVGIGR